MKKIMSPLLLGGSLLLNTAALAADIFVCSSGSGCAKNSSPWTLSTYAKTQYPIVLAHGMGGFSKLGPLDYWYGIPQDLAVNGGRVFITQVASFQSSEVRGEQLLNQVKQIRAITGAAKVNLIGHSHGSQSIRYVAGVLPGAVASATAVGGPNTGSPVADVIAGITTIPGLGPIAADAVSGIINGFFKLVGEISGEGYEQDSLAGMAALTTAGTADFNRRFPGGVPAASNPCGNGAATANGVSYYSWGGTGVFTNALDPVDYALAALQPAFGGTANDGLVPRCSSHLGKVIRDDYALNHFDQVNQVLGLRDLFAGNPVALFRQQANRLKSAGL